MKTTCPLSSDPEGKYCDDYCQWYDLEDKDCRLLTYIEDLRKTIHESAVLIANNVQ